MRPIGRRGRIAVRGTVPGWARSMRRTGEQTGIRGADPSSGRRVPARTPRAPVHRSAAGFGPWPPLAHGGVPQIEMSSSIPRSCAPRASSSMSSSRYDGSNGSVGSAGRCGAVCSQTTIVRMIAVPDSRARSSTSARSSAQRSEPSSWKPMRRRPGIGLWGRTIASSSLLPSFCRRTNRPARARAANVAIATTSTSRSRRMPREYPLRPLGKRARARPVARCRRG